jgi:proline iminopeptidase
VLHTALADLETLREHLGVARWHIGGHSWGADLALAYALHFPERTAQVVCISGGRIHHDRQWHMVYSLRRDSVGELIPPADIPYNMEVNAQMNQSWKDFCKRPDLLVRLANLQVPVHYILAGEDIRPNWPLQQVAALLPQGSQQIIHGAGHSIWMTHPEPLRSALRAALQLYDGAAHHERRD